jgi:hypothetical protein
VPHRRLCASDESASKPGIDGLSLQGQDTEHRFMDAGERSARHKALQRLSAKQEFAVLCSIGHRPSRHAIWRLRYLKQMKNI